MFSFRVSIYIFLVFFIFNIANKEKFNGKKFETLQKTA